MYAHHCLGRGDDPAGMAGSFAKREWIYFFFGAAFASQRSFSTLVWASFRSTLNFERSASCSQVVGLALGAAEGAGSA